MPSILHMRLWNYRRYYQSQRWHLRAQLELYDENACDMCGKCGDKQLKCQELENTLIDMEKSRERMMTEEEEEEEEEEAEEEEEEEEKTEEIDYEEVKEYLKQWVRRKEMTLETLKPYDIWETDCPQTIRWVI